MTIALGILATDGVVLAADTEISTNSEIKSISGKMVAATQEIYGKPPNTVGIAGAGTLGYFQSLRLNAVATVLQAVHPTSQASPAIALESLLLDFYPKHVIPFAAYPDAPDLALLVGAWANGVGTLLVTERTTVRHAAGCDAIGYGSPYAMSILANYFCWMPVESAAILAAYTISRVKFSISSCGKDTQIIILRNGFGGQLPHDLIAKCDHMLQNYAVFQTEALLSVAGVRESTQHVKDGVDAIRTDFDSLRQAIKLSSSSSSQM